MTPVGIISGAGWAGGAWLVDTLKDTASPAKTPLNATRIARADVLTQLGASVVERATDGLEACRGERVATIGGSVLASLRTNEKYERRRLRTGRAPPRDFPYTAPNAWMGEIAAALGVRGPNLCLVGSSDVGLVGVATAIRMIASDVCDRAVVVVAESLPDDRSLLPETCLGWVDGAATVVLERGGKDALAMVRAGWGGEPMPSDESLPSSVDALVRLMLCARGDVTVRITAPAAVGAACWVEVEPCLGR
jgi:Beta-ketoacyl synthase, N-terminal domain